MTKTLFLLLFCLTLFQNVHSFNKYYSADFNKTVSEILLKWENKELELSSDCGRQLLLFLENILLINDGAWAYKMIDASGKLSSGIAEGNIAIMGNFGECLKIDSNLSDVKGRYCTIGLDLNGIDILDWDPTQANSLLQYKKLTETKDSMISSFERLGSLPTIGICVPDKCSADDIESALRGVTSLIPLYVSCRTKDDIPPPLDTGAILTITVFGLTIGLMVLSTIYDCICQIKEIKPFHPVLISFSVYTNGQKLFRMRRVQGELGCINGIRSLSMCWVMLGHSLISNTFGPAINLFDLLEYLNSHGGMFFLNCVHAVDTFFVLAGLLVSYNFMKKMKKGEKFNVYQYYIHRYLRLTPPYAVLILTSIYLTKYLGSGPLYYQTESISGLCKKHWWKALLYLENYLSDKADGDMCISQSWNLNIDWQLYVLSPIFLFFIYKTPKFGTIMLTLPIIGCMIASYAITYQKHLVSQILHGNPLRYMGYYYNQTHTRAGAWFIGALLGYYLGRQQFYKNKTYLKLPRWLVLIIWCTVLAVIPTCIFGGHNLLTGDYDVVGNSSYNAFVRPAWALCISWIIFACTAGYGGIINNFLSLPIFGILSKFTYSMYLLHLSILYLLVYSRKMPAYFSVAGVMNQFTNIFAISFVVAIFWILAFEMPILAIEPYLFGNSRKPAKKQQVIATTPSNGESIRTGT